VRDGDALTIPLGDYAELERILAEVRQSGESVLELDVVQPDLQDVFLQVMTRS
jgi:ABC-2 type transport system ATP-binding protein